MWQLMFNFENQCDHLTKLSKILNLNPASKTKTANETNFYISHNLFYTAQFTHHYAPRGLNSTVSAVLAAQSGNVMEWISTTAGISPVPVGGVSSAKV